MSKTIVHSLLFALVGVFTFNLHAEIAWTKVEGVPSNWVPLADNLLAGKAGTTSGSISGYGGGVGLLTDGAVSGVTKQTCGFGSGATVEWSFNVPTTLERIRITSCDIPDGRQYDDMKIADIKVKTSASSEWVSLGCEALNWNGSNAQGIMLQATLEDVVAGYIAQDVTALRFVFAVPNNVAQYYSEIEAVGSASALGPVISSFDIISAKTKATLSGSITDVGTDATECDVYLSLDNAEAVKIAEGVTDSFEYQIQGLTAGTTYAYELSISNNAPTAKGTVISDEFTTLAVDAQTALWTTENVVPSSWTALSGNLLVGATGTTSGNIVAGDYATDNPSLLTDTSVPTSGGKDWIVGFGSGAAISWTFAAPKTLERIRVSACYLAGNTYTRLAITGVYVKLAGSETWDAIDAPAYSDIGGRNTSVVLCASLSDSEMGYLSQNVVGLKVAFGNVGALASYCAEIEAVGYTEATGPVLGALDIAPAKTKATISGSLADVGTDATACDVYFALGDAAAVKIADGVTGAFEHRLKGLSPGTEYTYTLSVSNNAPTAKGTVRNGSFTTLAVDASTAVWTTSEGVPGDFSPMADNILSNMVGITTGTLSGYGGSVALLTNGEVSGETKQTCGFYEGATVSWSFDTANVLKSIRITTCYTAGNGWYDDIKISKVEVKTSDSDSWTDLGVEPLNYAGSETAGTALFATLSDVESGCLVRNATALRITFGKPNNVAQYYAEIEAVGRVEPKPGFVLVVR